jgi:hypothetical protein
MWGELKDWFVKAWDTLDGHKARLGLYASAILGILIQQKVITSEDQQLTLSVLVIIWTGVGIVHRFIKDSRAKTDKLVAEVKKDIGTTPFL